MERTELVRTVVAGGITVAALLLTANSWIEVLAARDGGDVIPLRTVVVYLALALVLYLVSFGMTRLRVIRGVNIAGALLELPAAALLLRAWDVLNTV
jgi:uncharacterized membrane protein YidH (DUF202 family)